MAKVASSSTPGSRTKRIKKENEDRISGLPDAVLCHILSFLPTKYAVRTSILSRRWTFLWTSVPVLDFDDSLPVLAPRSKRNRKYETLFTSFVNRVLILHKMQSVRKFCLKLINFCDSSYVNAWISSAIMRTVDELDLCILGNEGTVQTLPRSLFISSEKLRVLKLRDNIILNVPDCVCFPSLKVLHLEFLKSLDNNGAGRLISGSPILEDLIIIRGFSDTLGVLYVHSHSLKTFQIDTGFSTSNPELYVNAPNLEFLKIDGSVYEKWTVSQMPSIVKAIIQVGSGHAATQESDDLAGMMVVQLLRQISNVKVLHLSDYTVGLSICLLVHMINSNFVCWSIRLSLPSCIFANCQTIAEGFRKHLAGFNNFPTFHNLTHLEMSTTWTNAWISIRILGQTPNLQHLVLRIYRDFLPKKLLFNLYSLNCMWHPPAIPECLLSSLKVVNFEGDEHPMEVIEYLLENALVLEKLTLPYIGSQTNHFKIAKELLMFPRASSSCRIDWRASYH